MSFPRRYNIYKTTRRGQEKYQKSGSRRQKKTHCCSFAETHTHRPRQARRQGRAQQALAWLIVVITVRRQQISSAQKAILYPSTPDAAVRSPRGGYAVSKSLVASRS